MKSLVKVNNNIQKSDPQPLADRSGFGVIPNKDFINQDLILTKQTRKPTESEKLSIDFALMQLGKVEVRQHRYKNAIGEARTKLAPLTKERARNKGGVFAIPAPLLLPNFWRVTDNPLPVAYAFGEYGVIGSTFFTPPYHEYLDVVLAWISAWTNIDAEGKQVLKDSADKDLVSAAWLAPKVRLFAAPFILGNQLPAIVNNEGLSKPEMRTESLRPTPVSIFQGGGIDYSEFSYTQKTTARRFVASVRNTTANTQSSATSRSTSNTKANTASDTEGFSQSWSTSKNKSDTNTETESDTVSSSTSDTYSKSNTDSNSYVDSWLLDGILRGGLGNTYGGNAGSTSSSGMSKSTSAGSSHNTETSKNHSTGTSESTSNDRTKGTSTDISKNYSEDDSKSWSDADTTSYTEIGQESDVVLDEELVGYQGLMTYLEDLRLNCKTGNARISIEVAHSLSNVHGNMNSIANQYKKTLMYVDSYTAYVFGYEHKLLEMLERFATINKAMNEDTFQFYSPTNVRIDAIQNTPLNPTFVDKNWCGYILERKP